MGNVRGKIVSILLLAAVLLISCDRKKEPERSGTATIDNELVLDKELQTYVNYGFLFSEARLASNVESPRPDITVFRDGDKISLDANNLSPSFYKYGEYNSQQEAAEAFRNLSSATVSRWEERATMLKINQIWLYRSNTERYAKIRIISIQLENRSLQEYVKCTFEWVYQPDGSLNFPGK
ncbi:MAG TPA: hypothetical protein PLZ75_01580 [Bacteroidales bacterium]|jgi:hypothetical protein|nr:hypothetical protein [Bacteroidales bacterium]HQH23763.1 hypothetical protein [Bacteroidales bacterium]HQJ81588.1 hypothetical protein [Bacteroidales bacterium]